MISNLMFAPTYTPTHAEIVAASAAFFDYLIEHYRDRMSEPMPYDQRPQLALAACRDSEGHWSVCLPLDLGDDEVIEWIDIHAEGVETRGDLIEYLDSDEWKGFLRWIAGVDENGDIVEEEESE
ncbi:hypothetical protein [Rhizobium terrae]|uniref:hypothetical protein n=1 Tax=Rhizobium terrae TaxID=2171756 RepID=UPI000E3CF606|nr:hypothetical protein [Rhizobium terrae]